MLYIELSGDEITGLEEILDYFAGQLPLVEKWAQQDNPKADAIVALCNLQLRISEQEDLENGDFEYSPSSDLIH
jgi:hypothetical protein